LDISQVENYMAGTMVKQVLKQAMGDGYEFELIYEALTETGALDNLLGTSNDTSAKTTSTSTSNSGVTIDSIPMTLRTTPIVSGEIYLNETINDSLYEGSNNNSLIDGLSEVEQLSSILADSSLYLDEIYAAVEKYSNEYGIDKNLILSIIKKESNFNKYAISSAGAKGLMQIMDTNSEYYGVENPYDIEENIKTGTKLLSSYIEKYDGDLQMALMAYNAGPGTMQKRGAITSSDLYKMPEETQNYVPSVLAYYNDYKNI